ncbi:hypothetical protein NEUTE1DRAFT_149495 [Neurospora tetrasperma FGSC 2508]|uniref:Elongator complex protein 6 n=1 Tax=Neurospora tetrasperma (strain FGSC 2508 / ATCC MYA-4615 / P0657) TaxID=510951 RepID=F8N3T8_NEUT8|nr:uncharacterized protein NEUTE1DRAFT_149495 [Neurospora tetrasperma FGSC 2508]EGO51788.1 hypothetical protein NEUTE1DRAFT_149495 [Neurospora tetrasperma FGSC 2508]
MTSRNIPHLLEPLLEIEPSQSQSQILLTGILGANTNWLLLRYLYTLLKSSSASRSSPPSRPPAAAVSQPQGQRRLGTRMPIAAEPEFELRTSTHAQQQQNGGDAGDQGESGNESVGVLLVSFLRDFAFWKESAGRLGLDLEGLGRRGKLGFVDGLCVGFGSSGSDGEGGVVGGGGGLPVRRPPVPLAATGGSSAGATGAVPGRGPPQAPRPATTTTTTTTTGGSSSQRPVEGERWKRSLPSLAVADVSKTLHSALDELCQKNKKVVLVIDQLDFLLAATSDGNGLVSSALQDLLLDLREKSHATILTLSADDPLIASQVTTLDKDHASFVLSLAHEAEMVVSLRLLDTGIAKDVSGVVRITRGGDSGGEKQIEEKEYLYHVGGDGSVRVFERGQ